LSLTLIFVCGTAFAADPVMDRTTPRRAYKGFRAACTSEDYETAARYVDSRAIARSDRGDVAESLCDIAARALVEVNADALPDTEDAGQNDVFTISTLDIDEEKIPFNFAHVRSSEGSARWVVARDTVAAIPELTAAYGRHGIEEHMPSALRKHRVMAMAPW